MIKNISLCVLLLSTITGVVNPALAEQIKLGISKQAPENHSINRPQRGMSKNQILELFGEPTSKTEPKGNPPISTWQYPYFSVYLESDYVIHSVLKHQPKTDKTKPTNDK